MQLKSHKLLAALTMLFAMGLFAAICPAQDQSSQSQQSQQPQQGQMQSNQVTATGCLQKSGSNSYTLTDQASNQTYTLTSSNVDLSAHVGHQVKVTGTPSSASASNPSASGQPSGQEQQQQAQTLDVSSLEMVSNSCSSGGASGSTANPPHLR